MTAHIVSGERIARIHRTAKRNVDRRIHKWSANPSSINPHFYTVEADRILNLLAAKHGAQFIRVEYFGV